LQLITANIDGSDIKLLVPDELWRLGGHHPNWSPDGTSVIMNLRPGGSDMSFVKFDVKSGQYFKIFNNFFKGSGHPSLDPTGQYLLTDAYAKEGFTDADGFVPIRIIKIGSENELELARVYTKKLDGPRRVDPHPVWSNGGKSILFNGVVENFRQVFFSDTDFLFNK